MADPDILDQVTKNVPWLVIPVTLLTAAPKLLEVWRSFTSGHDGLKQLEIEKARLENLKLRVEIEALKKQHNIDFHEAEIPVTALALGALAIKRSAALSSTTTIPTANVPVNVTIPVILPPKKIWGWLANLAKKWPGMTASAAGGLAVASVWLGLFSIFAFFAGGLAEWSTEPKEVLWYILGGCILFLLPGLALLKFGSSLKVQRTLLKNAMNPAPPLVA